MIPRKPRGQPKANRVGTASGWGRGAAGLWNKIHKEEAGCWIWTGYLDKDGSGKFTTRIDGRQRTLRARRYVYELHAGPLDPGTALLALCGQPACVRPDHSVPMTFRELGESRPPGEPADTAGEMSGCAKLTEDDVREIRSWSGVYGAAPLLAKLYPQVSIHHVRLLLSGRGWTRVRNHRPRERMPIARLRELVEQRGKPIAPAEEFVLRSEAA